MLSYIRQIIGNYSPVTVNGEVVEGIAGIDFAYIFAGVVFCIVLYISLDLFSRSIRELFNAIKNS